MTVDPATIDPAEAMLAQLAGLDLSLARHVHACAMATEDPEEVAELSRAYQRVARSLRQSLALHARFKREREREERGDPPPTAREPGAGAHVRERAAAVRAAVQRVAWAEYERERPDDETFSDDSDDRVDKARAAFHQLRERLSRHPALGLPAHDDAQPEEALDDQVIRVCRDLGLPEIAARGRRDLPDPPDAPPAEVDFESSA